MSGNNAVGESRIQRDELLYRREAVDYQRKRQFGPAITYYRPPLAMLVAAFLILTLTGYHLTEIEYTPTLCARLKADTQTGNWLLFLKSSAGAAGNLRMGDQIEMAGPEYRGPRTFTVGCINKERRAVAGYFKAGAPSSLRAGDIGDVTISLPKQHLIANVFARQ